MRESTALGTFHPLVRAWFTETLGSPSEPQRQGWPAIASGAHTLILAPTGTGKRLAALRRRPCDVEVETIDGLNAAATKWTDAFLRAGFRRETQGLRGF